MKLHLVLSLGALAVHLTGCASGHQSPHIAGDGGGIDPITLNGIEQSNAATEANNAAIQAGIDQSNRAAADAAAQAAANAQAAASASAPQ